MFKKIISEVAGSVGSAVGLVAGVAVGVVTGAVTGGVAGFVAGDAAGRALIEKLSPGPAPIEAEYIPAEVVEEPVRRTRSRKTAAA